MTPAPDLTQAPVPAAGPAAGAMLDLLPPERLADATGVRMDAATWRAALASPRLRRRVWQRLVGDGPSPDHRLEPGPALSVALRDGDAIASATLLAGALCAGSPIRQAIARPDVMAWTDCLGARTLAAVLDMPLVTHAAFPGASAAIPTRDAVMAQGRRCREAWLRGRPEADRRILRLRFGHEHEEDDPLAGAPARAFVAAAERLDAPD